MLTRRETGTSRRDWRKLWLNVHLYLALTVGFFFALLGLTGAFNVFHWELEEIGLPRPKMQEEAATKLLLNAIMTRLYEAYPRRKGSWRLFMPGYEHDYLWAIYTTPEKTSGELFAPHRIIIDPISAKFVAENYWGRTVWSLIYEIHASLLSGRMGAEIGQIGFKTVSFLGLFLLILGASGLYLWWPRSRQFFKAMRFKRGASSTRFCFDLHRVAGIYAWVVLMILALTGFSFGWKHYLEPVVHLFSPTRVEHFEDPEGLISRRTPGARRLAVEEAVAIADRIFPNAELRWISTPDGAEGVYAIEKRQAGEANRRRPRSKVWLNQYTGEVLAVEDPRGFTAGDTFFNLMWPLHNGEFLGLPSRVMWSFVGFIPMILYVTGTLLWLKKRRARKISNARRTRVKFEYCPGSLLPPTKVQDERN